MADILKVTTPLVERAALQTQTRPLTNDPSMPFNLSDVTRVVQTNDASELLQQNTGMVEDTKILANLMKDPSVTVSMMRNISLLQEVIQLIPANNVALTQEIQRLFDRLMLSPDQIAAELARQENSTTLFKGELFDQLRTLLAQNNQSVDVMTSIGILLKSINAAMSQQDSLDSVANNLRFLLDNLAGRNTSAQDGDLAARLLQSKTVLDTEGRQITHLSQILQAEGGEAAKIDLEALLNGTAGALGTTQASLMAQQASAQNLSNVLQGSRLTEKLDVLIQLLRSPAATANYNTLKNETLQALREVENSVLFSPEMEKTVPLTIYNLSRFNDNADFLPDAARLLMSLIDGDASKAALLSKLQSFIDDNLPARGSKRAGNDSEVMDTLSKIIGKHASSEELELVSGDKLEKIVQSLLSSPSNFTPLLHFILPVEFMDLKAFAEIWIDPNADEGTPGKSGGEMGTHMLMVFDIDGIGRFESELYIQEKKIAMNLLCPAQYVDDFAKIGPEIRKAIASTGYKFEAINVDRLERTHSLMDVFTDLPMKRTGIDVKI